ncbi:protein angel [Musca autumnalis]|uniref:protein angel n=1 Tax=Musca autumnalis TaxID=221902 RepID=UPI003CEC8BC9
MCALLKITKITINNRSLRTIVSKTLEVTKIKKSPTKSMDRRWVSFPKGCYITLHRQYRLLSYNILAQELITDNMFLYYDVNQKYLRWKNRIELLGQEIRRIRPDILCLQEVQHVHLKEIIKEIASKEEGQKKLEYVFKKRTGSRCDGCVIIYDKEKFKLIKELCVEYHTENSISNRENIGLLAKFTPRDDPSKKFIVATTHLLYNPLRNDVRICQINKLLGAIIDFAKHSSKNDIFCPVILTGDFNCTTDSAPFRILTDERRFISRGGNEDKSFKMEPICFGVNTASTYQNQWITVDYILKSCSTDCENSIQVNSTYNLPNLDTCQSQGKLPNKYIGSDHFSLAIEFSIV